MSKKKNDTAINQSEALQKVDTIQFKSVFNGYSKTEVTDYISAQHNAMDTTIASYEEKIDQIKTSNIMLSHEIENIRRENDSVRSACDEMTGRMKEIEVGAAKYDQALIENEDFLQLATIAARRGRLSFVTIKN